MSFEVPAGAIVTLIGSNGAGKTTTLRTISGLLKASTGSDHLRWRRHQGPAPARDGEARHCHVPEGRMVFANLPCCENLMMGAYLQRDRRADRKERDYVFSVFPRLSGAREAAGRHALRRRAADAGHRPRADEPAALPDAR
jgi:branched-chain amino acid transport system ATP-binding protein